MKTTTALTLLALCLIIALTAPGCAAANDPAQKPALTKDQWREDLRHYAREMPKRHMKLFHTLPQAEFERAVSELDSEIPSLEDHEIVVRLKQITARVGDGHTGVHTPQWFQLYPIALYWFGNELRVTATAREYERALGARVVQIGELPIAEVDARVRTCFPSAANENEWFALATSPAFITRPEMLHGLGVITDLSSAPFTFEDDQGSKFVLELKPIALPPGAARGTPVSAGWIPVAPPPLSRQKPAEKFWFTTLPDSTVYVNWRSYDGLGGNARELFKALDSQPVKRLVIDLRQNGGGDFFEGRENMIDPIKKRPELNQKGRFYVLVGRRTYSAAMVNAVDFRKGTNATLIGEPIGERPNSYSENDEFTLPNSRLVISYSTRYYKFVDQDVPAVEPDVRINPSWPEWKAGRDPILEWIAKQP
jgi:hypothetical protein